MEIQIRGSKATMMIGKKERKEKSIYENPQANCSFLLSETFSS